jgi:hypothetical protein
MDKSHVQIRSAPSLTIHKLTGILVCALVPVELTFDGRLSFLPVAKGVGRGEELCVAGFALPERRCIGDISNDSQSWLRHELIVSPVDRRTTTEECVPLVRVKQKCMMLVTGKSEEWEWLVKRGKSSWGKPAAPLPRIATEFEA